MKRISVNFNFQMSDYQKKFQMLYIHFQKRKRKSLFSAPYFLIYSVCFAVKYFSENIFRFADVYFTVKWWLNGK